MPDVSKGAPPLDLDPEYHAAAAMLELASALLWQPSCLSFDQWERILSPIRPRARRVVILHGLHGMHLTRVGERLGCSRTRAHQIWVRALPHLSKHTRLLRGS